MCRLDTKTSATAYTTNYLHRRIITCFMPLISFYSPSKHQKTRGFPSFSGSTEKDKHCMKSVRIRSYSGRHSISTYAVRMLENTDQNNSEYGHFLRSVVVWILIPTSGHTRSGQSTLTQNFNDWWTFLDYAYSFCWRKITWKLKYDLKDLKN